MNAMYDVTVSREGRWWMVEVPAIDGLTQARRLSEVEEMAASLIAVTLDIAPSKVKLGKITVRVPGIDEDFAAVKECVTHMREQARALEEQATAQMRDAATRLASADVPTRDIGTILGVSHQRASQLMHA